MIATENDIRNEEAFNIIHSRHTLKNCSELGKFTCSDVDGLLTFPNGLIVILEGKLEGYGLTIGQNLAFERIAKLDPVRVAVVVYHHDESLKVDVGNCPVHMVKWKNKIYYNHTRNVLETIQGLKKYIDGIIKT